MTNQPERPVTQNVLADIGGDGTPTSSRATAAVTPVDEAFDSSAAVPEQGLIEARAETARMRDQLLRTAADFENFRKRARREQDDAERRGREGMVKDFLPVFDNLERAIQHAEVAPDVKAVVDGLRMVAKQFVDTLERVGITRVISLGQPFDPMRHEAVQNLESNDVPAGVVLAEVQPGYRMGPRLIRPASVVVSKGPAAPVAP